VPSRQHLPGRQPAARLHGPAAPESLDELLESLLSPPVPDGAGEAGDFNAYGPELAAIMFLARVVRRQRPRLILECGAGISTLFLAGVLSDVHGRDGDIRYITLEESADVAAKMTASIAKGGFQRFTSVITLPLAETAEGGRRTLWYDLDDAMLRDLTGGRPLDMMLLAGPSDPHSSRFAAVPRLLPHARSGTCFFLDDAQRAGELEIARHWAARPYVELLGLKDVGEGLLAGQYRL
jgi:hypothetical protein